KVIWVTPAGAQGNKTQGIGVQFSDDESGQAAKTQIETLLGGHIGSTRSTHTL
ncbi:MAG: pilus assembly protein PilZ, partial [Rhodocyclales bacterium CG17_big_fil_post_rev_8_21_14_2_50_68_7]